MTWVQPTATYWTWTRNSHGPPSRGRQIRPSALVAAIQNSAILGMSFLADNDIRLVLDGHGAGTTGYLGLPESLAACASWFKRIRLDVIVPSQKREQDP